MHGQGRFLQLIPMFDETPRNPVFGLSFAHYDLPTEECFWHRTDGALQDFIRMVYFDYSITAFLNHCKPFNTDFSNRNGRMSSTDGLVL